MSSVSQGSSNQTSSYEAKLSETKRNETQTPKLARAAPTTTNRRIELSELLHRVASSTSFFKFCGREFARVCLCVALLRRDQVKCSINQASCSCETVLNAEDTRAYDALHHLESIQSAASSPSGRGFNGGNGSPSQPPPPFGRAPPSPLPSAHTCHRPHRGGGRFKHACDRAGVGAITQRFKCQVPDSTKQQQQQRSSSTTTDPVAVSSRPSESAPIQLEFAPCGFRASSGHGARGDTTTPPAPTPAAATDAPPASAAPPSTPASSSSS